MSFPRYPEYKDSGVEWLGGALNSPVVQSGMKDILLQHAALWETLRARAAEQSPGKSG